MSKPFEVHPALLVLLVVFFVSLMVILWGGSPILAFTTIVWFVLAGTAVVFLILYALVWLARKIYAPTEYTFQGASSLTLHLNNSSSKSSPFLHSEEKSQLRQTAC